MGKYVVFGADAAFTKPELYEAVEERKAKHAIRLPASDSSSEIIGELLSRHFS